jgi:hypothetical protein
MDGDVVGLAPVFLSFHTTRRCRTTRNSLVDIRLYWENKCKTNLPGPLPSSWENYFLIASIKFTGICFHNRFIKLNLDVAMLSLLVQGGHEGLEVTVTTVFDSCDCCVVQGQLVPDGHWVRHAQPSKNATCIKGRLYQVNEIDDRGNFFQGTMY